MDIPQGYKQTELGIIPDDWEVKRISDFTSIITGGTPSTLRPEYWGGNIMWMSSGELNKKFVFDVEGRITTEGLLNSSTHMIPPFCVLIGLAGQGKTRGTAAYNYISLCTNQSIAAIYNPQIQISAESETKRSIFREKDKTKRSKKESAQHSKSRNKSFVMTSVSAL